MGIMAWMAIGRALSIALANSLLFGNNGLVVILAKEISNAIIKNDLETAKMLLKDMAWRYKKEFDDFVNKYKDDLPPELFDELTK